MSDPSGIIGPIYDTSIAPERIEDLIRAWEAYVSAGEDNDGSRLGFLGAPEVLPHVERALTIMSQLHGGDHMFLSDALDAIRLVAFVLTPQGVVVATNAAAQSVFDLYPGDSVRRRMGGNTAFSEIAAWIDRELAGRKLTYSLFPQRLGPGGRLRIVSIQPTSTPSGGRRFLVCTSDILWPDDLGARLSRSYGLTAAEMNVLRHLAEGETVSGIAEAGRRKESTVRSQVHALMSKTGTQSQAELVRLVHVLLSASPVPEDRLNPERSRESTAERKTSLRLPDGRRIDVFAFGRPAGRPVVWLQSTIGIFRPTASQEIRMSELNLRVIVPIRAGFGGSDPLPAGAGPLEVAVADTFALLDMLEMPRVAVVAPADDIRLALMMARQAPDRIARIVALGPCFPIRDDAQYQRLHRTGRFFRGCARNAPAVLPFLAAAFRAMVMRIGIESFAQRAMAGSQGDTRLLADRDVAEAFIAGFTYLFGAGARPEAAFCAELAALHADWPEDLGEVRCPVRIYHGAEDGNAPVGTARDYAALYPAWELEVVPSVGQLVFHAQWDSILRDLSVGFDAGPGGAGRVP
jgi:pimeloyl-ACP methyl ester carboxylesterase/DNA-binding CsgD family transcriptional regulator